MLSRIAENFYWIGRYVERVNSTVNLLDVTHLSGFEQDTEMPVQNLWQSLITVNQGMEFFNRFHESANEFTVHSFLIFSKDNASSILSCLHTVRENMRAVRNRVSNPMWLIVNEFYLELKDRNVTDILSFDAGAFYRQVKGFCLAFFGACDNTLMHDEAWQFLRLGRSLERAVETASILDLKYHILLESLDDVGKPVDLHQWQILLQSVDGLEPYLNTYLNRIEPASIAELLIMNRRFPKSVMFNLNKVHHILESLPHHLKSTPYWFLNQKILGVVTELQSTSIPVIFEAGFHEYLQGLIRQLNTINGHVYQTYFGYTEEAEQQ